MSYPALSTLPADPLALFADWHAEADDCEAIQYASAACLSTVSADGWPSGRIVLVHEVGDKGFAFFTDKRSPKGQALAAVSRAALTFYWGPLERQVRVQGDVQKGDVETADRFFEGRPRRSQITAWASAQSEPLPDPSALDQRMTELDIEYEGRDVPRPPYWQVYRLRPRRMEFWQAAARRLHDRVQYTRSSAGNWERQRLYP